MEESKEAIEKMRKSMDVSLLIAENYQNRCHEGEIILTDFYLLHWWEFGKRKKLKAKYKAHYEKFINVNFNSYIKRKI
jgi:hypothetical protein